MTPGEIAGMLCHGINRTKTFRSHNVFPSLHSHPLIPTEMLLGGGNAMLQRAASLLAGVPGAEARLAWAANDI